MKIGEVEEKTGVSRQNIRFYEKKGLLQIKRNQENAYRDYTEEDVLTLRMIRLYRYLEFSIEEIRELLGAAPEEIRASLEEKDKQLYNQLHQLDGKRDAMQELIKGINLLGKGEINDQELVEGFSDAVSFQEAIREAEKEAYEHPEHSLAEPLGISLFFLLSFFATVFNFLTAERDWKTAILLSGGLAVTAVMAAFSWNSYIREKKNPYNEKKTFSGRLKKIFWFIIMIAAVVLLIFAVYELILLVRELFFSPGQVRCYFWQHHAVFGNIGFWIPLEMWVMLLFPVFTYLSDYGKKEKSFISFIKELFLVRHWKLILPVNLLVLYLAVVNVTYAGKDAVYVYDTFHPLGTVIPYSEIEGIEVGYYGKRQINSVLYSGHEKGDFYYKILLDGEYITFDNIYTENVYENEALSEFDETLVSLGIPKKVNTDSLQYEKYMYLDEEYKAGYRKIIKNGIE